MLVELQCIYNTMNEVLNSFCKDVWLKENSSHLVLCFHIIRGLASDRIWREWSKWKQQRQTYPDESSYEGQTPTLDPTFPIIQPSSVFTLDPFCQSSFILSVCGLLVQAQIALMTSLYDITRAIFSDFSRFPQSHRKHNTTVFTALITSKLNLLCKIGGVAL